LSSKQTEQMKLHSPEPFELQYGDSRESANMKTIPVESDFFIYSSTQITGK